MFRIASIPLSLALASLALVGCGSVEAAHDDGSAGGGSPAGRGGAGAAIAGQSGAGGAGSTGGGSGASAAGTGGAAPAGATGTGGASGAGGGGGVSVAGTTGTAGTGAGGTAGAPLGDVRPQIETKISTSAPAISPSIRVWNNGAAPLPLGRLALRYWYTSDGSTPAAQTATCLYATNITGGCAAISVAFVSVPARPSGAADAYALITFKGDAGAVAPSGAASAEISVSWMKPDGSAFVQSNDWSAFASTTWAGNPHLTAYVDGALAAGDEP